MDPMIRDKTGLAFLIKQTGFHRLFTTMHQFTDWSRVMSAWRGSVIYLSFARTGSAVWYFRKKLNPPLWPLCTVNFAMFLNYKSAWFGEIKSEIVSANPVLHLPRHDPTPEGGFSLSERHRFGKWTWWRVYFGLLFFVMPFALIKEGQGDVHCRCCLSDFCSIFIGFSISKGAKL